MPNKEGTSDGFDYVDGEVKMRATATTTDWFSFPPPGHVDDPQWNIWNSDGKNHLLGCEWLPYTLKGERWTAKIHATNGHRNLTGIVSWFEHCKAGNGSDCHKKGEAHDCHDAGGSNNYDDHPVIHFHDWDGSLWEAEIGVVEAPFKKAPQFTLRRL